ALDARVPRFPGSDRPPESCVEDTGLAVVWACDDGDGPHLADRPVTQPAWPGPGAPGFEPAFTVRHGRVPHDGPVQTARDRPEFRGKFERLDEEVRSTRALFGKPLDHRLRQAMIQVG